MDTSPKWNENNTFRRLPGCHMKVLCKFSLSIVSLGPVGCIPICPEELSRIIVIKNTKDFRRSIKDFSNIAVFFRVL